LQMSLVPLGRQPCVLSSAGKFLEMPCIRKYTTCMNYTPPSSVNSPKDCVSNVQVVYDGGDKSVSVAKLDWDGEPCIAMRWNVARREWDDPEKKSGKRMAVGMPTSHGYPV